jgi:hypothetical protein
MPREETAMGTRLREKGQGTTAAPTAPASSGTPPTAATAAARAAAVVASAEKVVTTIGEVSEKVTELGHALGELRDGMKGPLHERVADGLLKQGARLGALREECEKGEDDGCWQLSDALTYCTIAGEVLMDLAAGLLGAFQVRAKFSRLRSAEIVLDRAAKPTAAAALRWAQAAALKAEARTKQPHKATA